MWITGRAWFVKKHFVVAVATFLPGVLTILLGWAYSARPLGNVAVLVLILWALLCAGYYFVRVWPSTQPADAASLDIPKVPRKRIVDDLLIVAAGTLGVDYHVNIMRPNDHSDVARRSFKILSQYNMRDWERFNDGRLRLGLPGVGTAYLQEELVYVGPTGVDPEIDGNCKHVWSISITPDDGARCVLNVGAANEGIAQAEIERIGNAASELARVLKKYNPGRLPLSSD